ncbi:CopD family protein [Actinokineospora inagensis]|uniref:copper resistance CopC/CopD family protein n=1 Tax=Actinokineospora inagensis TaxID=103730 RepID=UPI000410E653|nr:CopD family protein [Actinokineospora inagensis]
MRLAGILSVLACWAVLAAPPAVAHVAILGSTPAEGTRLTSAPGLVSVRLSENIGIQANSLKVVDVRGATVSTGPVFQPGDDAEEVAIRVKPGLPDGTYLVQYAFISEDSHPVRGGFGFVVGTGPLINASGAISAADSTDPTVDVATRAVRWLGYAGVVLAGGLVFLLYCRPTHGPVARRLVLGGCVLIGGSAILSLGLEGAYVAGAGLSRVFAPDLVATTLAAAYGKLLVVRTVAALALFIAARRLSDGARNRGRFENIAMVSGFLVLLSSAAAGHAISTQVMFLSLLADLAHYAGIAVWLGGVVQLALCARQGKDLGPAMARFSPIAKISVAVVVLSGALMSVAYLGSVSALVDSTYGLLLLGKVIGFGLLLVLADQCRLAVRRNATAPSGTTLVETEIGTLRRVLVIEVALAAAVLAVAAVLVTTGPPH